MAHIPKFDNDQHLHYNGSKEKPGEPSNSGIFVTVGGEDDMYITQIVVVTLHVARTKPHPPSIALVTVVNIISCVQHKNNITLTLTLLHVLLTSPHVLLTLSRVLLTLPRVLLTWTQGRDTFPSCHTLRTWHRAARGKN